MNEIIILRGIPGSGKTTLANELAYSMGKIVSADQFFTKDSEYKFDKTKLSQAHGWCFREAIRYLEIVVSGTTPPGVLVIDNTNITNIEVAPYVQLAQAFGCKHKIMAIYTEELAAIALFIERNIHGVAPEQMMLMYNRYLKEVLNVPKWWKQELVRPVF